MHVHVRAHVRVHVHGNERVYAFMSACGGACVHACVHVWVCVQACVLACMCACVRLCMRPSPFCLKTLYRPIAGEPLVASVSLRGSQLSGPGSARCLALCMTQQRPQPAWCAACPAGCGRCRGDPEGRAQALQAGRLAPRRLGGGPSAWPPPWRGPPPRQPHTGTASPAASAPTSPSP